MELLTKQLRQELPALYSQDGSPDPIVHVKFFTPDSGWTWYVTEGSPDADDFLLFGYVVGLEREWGYFRLSDLQGARGPLGLPIERDIHFMPKRFSRVAQVG